MFRLIIEDKFIDYHLETAAEVANAVFENTGLWMLASHVKEVCACLTVGDKWENKDAGIIIIKEDN